MGSEFTSHVLQQLTGRFFRTILRQGSDPGNLRPIHLHSAIQRDGRQLASTVPGRRMWTWVFRNEDPFDQKLFGLHQPNRSVRSFQDTEWSPGNRFKRP